MDLKNQERCWSQKVARRSAMESDKRSLDASSGCHEKVESSGTSKIWEPPKASPEGSLQATPRDISTECSASASLADHKIIAENPTQKVAL